MANFDIVNHVLNDFFKVWPGANAVSVSLRFKSKRKETVIFHRIPEFLAEKAYFSRETGATMSYGAHTLPKNRADRAEQDGVDENTRFPLKN